MKDTMNQALARQVLSRAEAAYREAVQRYAATRSQQSLRMLHDARRALTAVDVLATRWCKGA